MNRLLVGVLLLLSFTASATLLRVDGDTKSLGLDACRGMISAHIVENASGQAVIQLKDWYRQSGWSASHYKYLYLNSNLKAGTFVIQGDELFYVDGLSQIAIASRDNSVFASYTWALHSNVKIDIAREATSGTMGHCTVTPTLLIQY